jgi:hypothetical protein
VTSAKRVPSFVSAVKAIERGHILVPAMQAYIRRPDWPEFDVKVRNLGERSSDGWFHPSEHPGWSARALYLYLVRPEVLVKDPWDPMVNMSVVAGSIWHSIMEHILKDELGLLVATEVRLRDEEVGARGSMDGRLVDEAFEFKGLPLDTPIPTPTGWTTIGDVEVGDELFGSNGKPCRVVGMSTPKWVEGVRLLFDDGTDIVCDVDHRWVVEVGQPHRMKRQVLTAAEVLEILRERRDEKSKVRIINALPLDLPDMDLPIHPYVLGAWIGDGSKHNGAITQGDNSPLWGVIESCGYPVGKPWGTGGLTRTIGGLRKPLREMGLLGQTKHIPKSYLRASATQRLLLLQGLMDTDGTWSALRKNAVYSTIEPGLAEQVRELVVSLGMRCRIQKFTARGFGVERSAFHVVFSPVGLIPFVIKAYKMEGWTGALRSGRRVVSRAESTPVILTKCVAVDSVDHTYLCGDQMVPTHNTMSPRMISKIGSAEEFLIKYQGYGAQAQEYLRMSGLKTMRVLCMMVSFPFDMIEFTIDYDEHAAMTVRNKYLAVRQAVADQRMPECGHCDKSCSAYHFCVTPRSN